MSVRAVLGALQAIAATTVECELTREFGVAWIPRADGRGNEIQGISQAQMDAYSTRTVQVHEKERELAQVWARKHGRAPTSRELLHIANAATLQSRRGKDAAAIDWDALARRWDATLSGALAAIAPAVSNTRGPGVQGREHHVGRAPSGPPAREAQARALAKALVVVSCQHPAWTRHDLLKQLALVLPAESRQMSPEEAPELLFGLAEEALSGRSGEVVCLEAPEWPPVPPSLRRELDGRSIYTRPGVARYATTAQLSMEERLVAHAQTQAAPRLPRELAARRLGADPALLDAQLRGRAREAREQSAPHGLRMDQAAAIWHVLTSARTVEVITGAGQHPAAQDPQRGLGGGHHRVRALPRRRAQRRRPGSQLLAGHALQTLPQLVRGGEAQMADLVESLDLGGAGRALGHHQRPDRLGVPVPGLGRAAGPAGQRGPGRLDGIQRVGLAGPAAGLAVGAVDLDYLHPCGPQVAGQPGSVGAGALHADPGHRPEPGQPVKEPPVPAGGGGEFRDCQQPADLI
jgi:TrwC relaxase